MSDPLHLALVLRFDAGTIDGQLRNDDGAERAFHGWLGLMAALDQLTTGDAGCGPGVDSSQLVIPVREGGFGGGGPQVDYPARP